MLLDTHYMVCIYGNYLDVTFQHENIKSIPVVSPLKIQWLLPATVGNGIPPRHIGHM